MRGSEPGRRAANGDECPGLCAVATPQQSHPFATSVPVGPIEGRVALVTEGHRGVALQTVRVLAEQGMRVVLATRSARDGWAAVGTLGDLSSRVAVRQLDVMDAASVARLTYWLDRRMRRCDVLVTNAPVTVHADGDGSLTGSESVWTGLIGALRLIRAIVPLMRAHRYGRIVNVFRVAAGAAAPRPGSPTPQAYRSSIDVMTWILSEELAGDGILVNAWCPATAPSAPCDNEAAETPAWLATLPADGPTGCCYRGRAPTG